MKIRILIISVITLFIIGISIFAQNKSENKYNTSDLKYKLNSEWNSTKNISRINDSNEVIEYKKVDVIVILKEKIIGDTTAIDPLIIDLNKNNIVIENGLFSKLCKVEFEKAIQQKFKTNTNLTTINTELKGKISYSIDYETKGFFKYKIAEEIITDKIMNDIYKHLKENIEIRKPVILGNNYQIETPSKQIKIRKNEL
jgi:hypothetical protein